MRRNRIVAIGITALAVAVTPAAPAFAATTAGNGAAAGESLVPPAVFGVIATGFDTITPVLNGLPGIPLAPLGLPAG